MSAVRAIAEHLPFIGQKTYEFKRDKHTGRLYLSRRRLPYLGELPYVALLMIAVCFALTSYVNYIQLRTSVECRIDRLEVLERQYHTMQNDNMLMERTVTAPDFSEIYEIATEELGMVPISRKYIRTYYRTNREFVYQRDNIPIIGYQ